ncbi:MAG: biotin--[Bacteroidaceae bacterium]|nr:biotin--[acetyl-CoA-carboxylase] ligase [Bacteroidaceae bacterium]MBO7347073.1 biotin--[acetyl-CoA-carboxylase] ligase [Bacteroidaceae bacterium]MBQ2073894.1 biotin--[acetyl-CoA-carboxylase] ligase [Bacteroidaceae bacterium]
MIIEAGTITSTNDFLRDYAPEEDITIAWTQFQTNGRGQCGAWISDPGLNLLFSILLVPSDLAVSDGFILSQANALALRDTLREYIDDVHIKWPNDIYTNDRKIAGTLIENQLQGKYIRRSVIGTGINVNQKQFPDGLAAPATSIALETGKSIPPVEILHRFVQYFQSYCQYVRSGQYDHIRNLYCRFLYLLGQEHVFTDRNGNFAGTVQGVEPNGHLIIQDTYGKERRYAFKEVRIATDSK